MAALASIPAHRANPIDMIERLASRHSWHFDRTSDDEVNMVLEGSWGDLHLSMNWCVDLEGLHMASTFDLKVPAARREEVRRVTAMINEQLLFGHFDIWPSEGSLMFRNGLILAGGANVTEAQCEALIHLALDASQRYFPVFQFVIWAGKSAEQALELSLLETLGEA